MTKNPDIQLNQTSDKTEIILLGDWVIEQQVPDTAFVFRESKGKLIYINASNLGDWDSRLITFLVKLKKHALKQSIDLDLSTLPEGAQRLVKLAFAVEEREGARKHSKKKSIFTIAGSGVVDERG